VHQEKRSVIIVGCGVYNWAANCDPVVTTAIRLMQFSWTIATDAFTFIRSYLQPLKYVTALLVTSGVSSKHQAAQGIDT
jgi:hypothetical protein